MPKLITSIWLHFTAICALEIIYVSGGSGME